MSDQPEARTAAGSVIQLIEQFYSMPTTSVSGRELVAVGVSRDGLDDELKVIRARATQDPLVEVPVRILRACSGVDARSAIRERLVALARAAMDVSPVFNRLGTALDGNDRVSPLGAVRVSDEAKSTGAAALGIDSESFRPEDRDSLRRNAVATFLLYQVLTSGWRPEKVVAEAVAARLWPAPPADAQRLESAIADMLVSRAPKGLGLVGHTSHAVMAHGRESVREAQAEAERDRRRALKAETGNRDLREDLAREEARADDLHAQITKLEGELAAERKHRVADKSHHIDDYEALRTKVMRNLAEQAELLDDGLHALRDGVTDVADEFVERALDAIRSEVSRLKSLGRSQR